MTIEIGKKYKIYFSENNINNKTIHVLAIVDEDQVVYKWWSKRKDRWIYVVDDMMWFDTISDNIRKAR